MARINCRQIFQTKSEDKVIQGHEYRFCKIETHLSYGAKDSTKPGYCDVTYKDRHTGAPSNFTVQKDDNEYMKLGANWYRKDPAGNLFLIGTWTINSTVMQIDTNAPVDTFDNNGKRNTSSSIGSVTFNYKRPGDTGAEISQSEVVTTNPGALADLEGFVERFTDALTPMNEDLSKNKPSDGIKNIKNGSADDKAWIQGIQGEMKTADELNKIFKDNPDAHILHSIKPMPNHADIDHLLICTKGVFLIDSKTTQAQSVNIHDDCVDGVHNGDQIIKKNREHADELMKALYVLIHKAGKTSTVYVNDLISVWPVDGTVDKDLFDQSNACYGGDLDRYLDDYGDTLSSSQVAWLFKVLRKQSNWTKAYQMVSEATYQHGHALDGYEDAEVKGEPCSIFD